MSQKKDKLLIGPRLRRFRQTLGLTQARMAEDLGISTSYLNLMERNQRALSAKVLLKMAEVYDFDISDFTGAGDAHLVAEIYETLRDPLFNDGAISKNKAEDLVNISPNATKALLKLYGKHRDLARRNTDMAQDIAGDRDKVELLERSTEAVDTVRRFIHQQKNFFPRLDAAAEALSHELGMTKREPHAALTERLKKNMISVFVLCRLMLCRKCYAISIGTPNVSTYPNYCANLGGASNSRSKSAC